MESANYMIKAENFLPKTLLERDHLQKAGLHGMILNACHLSNL
jgi:hypothetical protein